eukprot:3054322-Amphidinium_carterae.1
MNSTSMRCARYECHSLHNCGALASDTERNRLTLHHCLRCLLSMPNARSYTLQTRLDRHDHILDAADEAARRHHSNGPNQFIPMQLLLASAIDLFPLSKGVGRLNNGRTW